jgi:hypothetical protein
MREVQGELNIVRGAGGSHVTDGNEGGIRFRVQMRVEGRRVDTYLTPSQFADVITGAHTAITVETELAPPESTMTGLELVALLQHRSPKQPIRVTPVQARIIGYHDGLVGTAHVIGALSEWVLGCTRPLSDEGKAREAVTAAYTAGYADGCRARTGS